MDRGLALETKPKGSHLGKEGNGEMGIGIRSV